MQQGADPSADDRPDRPRPHDKPAVITPGFGLAVAPPPLPVAGALTLRTPNLLSLALLG